MWLPTKLMVSVSLTQNKKNVIFTSVCMCDFIFSGFYFNFMLIDLGD